MISILSPLFNLLHVPDVVVGAGGDDVEKLAAGLHNFHHRREIVIRFLVADVLPLPSPGQVVLVTDPALGVESVPDLEDVL